MGALITALLLCIMSFTPGWPVHPLGYAFAGTYMIYRSCFSCLVAWMLKATIVKYGGGRSFRACTPFFIGLIVAGFITPGIWALIDLCLGRVGNPIPTLPP